MGIFFRRLVIFAHNQKKIGKSTQHVFIKSTNRIYSHEQKNFELKNGWFEVWRLSSEKEPESENREQSEKNNILLSAPMFLGVEKYIYFIF